MHVYESGLLCLMKSENLKRIRKIAIAFKLMLIAVCIHLNLKLLLKLMYLSKGLGKIFRRINVIGSRSCSCSSGNWENLIYLNLIDNYGNVSDIC